MKGWLTPSTEIDQEIADLTRKVEENQNKKLSDPLWEVVVLMHSEEEVQVSS